MSILINGMEMPRDIEPGLVIEFADGIDGKRYARLWHYRHGGLTEWLEAVSTADVRPVVRGHWISEEEAEEKGDYSLRDACSVCGHCDWDCTESAGFNYCPNCGADMRGDRKE